MFAAAVPGVNLLIVAEVQKKKHTKINLTNLVLLIEM